MGALIELRGVSRSFGGRNVLEGVSLQVPRGAHVMLTGRSGSGKSTLLKLMGGLDAPTRGQVLLDGVDLSTLEDDELAEIRLRKIGLLFQSPMLLPDLSVRENVLLPLHLAKRRRAEAEQRVARLLDMVGVSSLAARRPNSLSGGEAQRVSIARALANDPAILLADEPTTGLDRANAQNVLELLEEAQRNLGTTVIVASHDPVAIERAQARIDLDDGVARVLRDPGHTLATTSRF